MAKKHGESKRRRLSLVQSLENYKKSFETAKKTPSIDLKKVNRLRKAIREGTYQIDFAKLADKLLEDNWWPFESS